MRKIGLDITTNVEAVQICPNGRGVIFVTLKGHVSVDKFLNYDVIEVNQAGVRAIHVKPGGKREVILTLRGLHPNTSDQGVLDYFSKFGKIVTPRVIHCVYSDGPLMGVKNGDRNIKMEIKPNTNIETYHVLFGSKVTVKYPGQKQTCARCYQSGAKCPGGGLAKRCEAAGGEKMDFNDFIFDLWGKIGYSPADVEVASLYDDLGSGEITQMGGVFTPTHVQSEPKEFKGVIVKYIPKETDHGDIFDFLTRSGLPMDKHGCVEVKENGNVTISNIESELCLMLVRNIHKAKFCDKKLVCNGVIPITPAKLPEVTNSVENSEQSRSIAGGEQTLPENSTKFASQLERQKSVKELVTDFSSCISSSEDDNVGDWNDAVGSRRKKRWRGASTSPHQPQTEIKVAKIQ